MVFRTPHLLTFIVLTWWSPRTVFSSTIIADDMIPIGPKSGARGRTTYYLSKENVKKNWNGAAAFCIAAGMELLSIESSAEDMQIMGLLNGVDQVWSSGNDLMTTNDYYWQGTGRPMIYNHWDFFGTVSPNDSYAGAIFIGGTTCGAACNKNWVKDTMSSAKRFVCESKSDAEKMFTNPIMDGPSEAPSVLKFGDHYYLTLAEEEGSLLVIYKSPTLTDFRFARRHVAYTTIIVE